MGQSRWKFDGRFLLLRGYLFTAGGVRVDVAKAAFKTATGRSNQSLGAVRMHAVLQGLDNLFPRWLRSFVLLSSARGILDGKKPSRREAGLGWTRLQS